MTWTPRRIFAFALGLWMAFAPVLLVGPSAAMAMQAGMSDGAAPGGCDGCPDAGMDRDICAMMCANALTPAMLQTQGDASPVVFQTIDWPVRDRSLTGRDLAPEPGPPRPA